MPQTPERLVAEAGLEPTISGLMRPAGTPLPYSAAAAMTLAVDVVTHTGIEPVTADVKGRKVVPSDPNAP